MVLPQGVQYGQVSWQALSAVADGNDADGDPDSVPVSGTVTFTASTPTLAVGGLTAPVTVFLTPVTYALDNSGFLVDSQRRRLITLVANDTVPGVTWTWTASYRLNDGLARGSIGFTLPAGSVVDLTNPTVPLYNGSPTPPVLGTVSGVDNGDGTDTVAGSAVVDNGDGTFTMSSLADSGDGTFIISA